ncbi:sialidase family protein [Streptomyces sp. NRRL S-337]|uniref:sialidase family protein n=1 Tax=Streptomyces sp. NRRL S-337 TaxID=1463900 RepID=UPI0004C8C2EE|nr:sialidase family protein [Streptomyces sp. NRRL S-337]
MAYESSVPYRAGTERYTSFRIPADPPADGRRVRLRHGDDDGATWNPPRAPTDQVERLMTRRAPDQNTAGLLHETGDFSAYSTITFRRIPVEEPA